MAQVVWPQSPAIAPGDREASRGGPRVETRLGAGRGPLSSTRTTGVGAPARRQRDLHTLGPA
eukprot:3599399-Alexandrium_andersonii.AAC.1